MKKFIITLIAAIIAIIAMAAGTKMWLYSHSGNHQSIDVADVDSISFIEHSDITFTVTDICGNTYDYVKIGEQYWMTENMRCNQYDTQSGCTGVTLSTSSSATYTPYYTDGSNSITEYSDKLTSVHRNKLGYLYNWTAAVGLEDESAALSQATPFDDRCQGICPNGWHVPTDAEWDTLKEYIGPNVAGKKLKAASGWYSSGNGTDDYSFAALPAGQAEGGTVYHVGDYALFWTATPNGSDSADGRNLGYGGEGLSYGYFSKSYARSVRCAKN